VDRQYCPECGSDVPVDDVTGVCHVGHPVNSPRPVSQDPSSAGVDEPSGAPATFPVPDDDMPAGDGPAPWVATVDDDAEPAPIEEVAMPDDLTPSQDEDDASLEELATMAAASSSDLDGADDADADDAGGDAELSALSDDLRGDLGGSVDADEGFDLDSLEAAVADLGGQAAAEPVPDLAPLAPGPDEAPGTDETSGAFTGVADVAPVPDDLGEAAASPATSDGPDGPDELDGPDEPVPVRPDHDDVASMDAPAWAAGPDPTSFTASGKRVSSASPGGQSLVDRLKRLFTR